jgi:hypothetical protein
MLYRVSLTGNHNRFSVPQLGYLGYHSLTLINLIGISATDLADCKEQNSRGLETDLDHVDEPLLANQAEICSC